MSKLTASSYRAKSLFTSHGAGPLVLLGVPHQQPLIAILEGCRHYLDEAQGVIIFTAHWETDHPTISAADQYKLLYDYPPSLPKEAFEFQYPAPGSNSLAQLIRRQLEDEGFQPVMDYERGWDHGVYVPMQILRPSADLPIVQMSVLKSKDSAEHFRLGQAMEKFLDMGFVILGSGSSFHNLADVQSCMREGGLKAVRHSNKAFEDALKRAAEIEDAQRRKEALLSWRTFQNSTYIQPVGHEEHFMPLMVAAGAGGNQKGQKLDSWELFGAELSTYVW